MHVLVCDDDKTTRFVIHRLLVQRMDCRVTEVRDGVEALERLAVGDVDLLILDLSMPTLDGVEVLEAIRRSPQFGRLPVIVLSHERRQEIVVKLIQLGIVGYVAKPPTAEALLAVVERARRANQLESSETEVRLGAGTPALLVDGDLEYRRHFVSHAEAYGSVLAVESGLTALAAFKREPPSLVFIGRDVGVVGRDLLIRKLREMRKGHPLRIVELREPDDHSSSPEDDVMTRTIDSAKHRLALRRFVHATGPLDDLCAVTGNVSDELAAATTQVFGMMLDVEVRPSATMPLGVIDVCSTLEMRIRHQFVVRLDFCMSKQDAGRIAARMRSLTADAVTDEHVTSAMTEILKLVRRRLQATIAARQVECECSSPLVRHQESMEIEVPKDGYGLQLPFSAVATGDFTLLATVAQTVGSSLVARPS